MLRTILFASVVLVPLTAPAFASCTDSSPSNGEAVTCTGTDTQGVKNNSANGVAVTVAPGASVSNADLPGNHTIHLRDNANVVVYGALSSTGSSTRDALNLRHNATVEINGSVTTTNAESDGVQAEDGLDLTINSGGTLTAGKKGVNGGDGDGSKVLNHGVITAGTEGVELGDSGKVTNYGTIIADDDALNVGEDALIMNYGTIWSKSDSKGPEFVQDGIDLDSGTIWNFGNIFSDDDAAIDFDATDTPGTASVIHNNGVIQGVAGIIVETGYNADGTPNGEAANTASQVIYNNCCGTIVATGGPALKLGAGDDAYFGAALSSVTGLIDMGDGNDLVQVSTGASIGDVDFGTGDDLFTVTDRVDWGWKITFGLIDGGEGNDQANFLDYAWGDVTAIDWLDDVLSVKFLDELTVNLMNFESFSFSDTTVLLADMAMPAVPLPAPALMLVSALGGLVLLRRRR